MKKKKTTSTAAAAHHGDRLRVDSDENKSEGSRRSASSSPSSSSPSSSSSLARLLAAVASHCVVSLAAFRIGSSWYYSYYSSYYSSSPWTPASPPSSPSPPPPPPFSYESASVRGGGGCRILRDGRRNDNERKKNDDGGGNGGDGDTNYEVDNDDNIDVDDNSRIDFDGGYEALALQLPEEISDFVGGFGYYDGAVVGVGVGVGVAPEEEEEVEETSSSSSSGSLLAQLLSLTSEENESRRRTTQPVLFLYDDYFYDADTKGGAVGRQRTDPPLSAAPAAEIAERCRAVRAVPIGGAAASPPSSGTFGATTTTTTTTTTKTKTTTCVAVQGSRRSEPHFFVHRWARAKKAPSASAGKERKRGGDVDGFDVDDFDDFDFDDFDYLETTAARTAAEAPRTGDGRRRRVDDRDGRTNATANATATATATNTTIDDDVYYEYVGREDYDRGSGVGCNSNSENSSNNEDSKNENNSNNEDKIDPSLLPFPSPFSPPRRRLLVVAPPDPAEHVEPALESLRTYLELRESMRRRLALLLLAAEAATKTKTTKTTKTSGNGDGTGDDTEDIGDTADTAEDIGDADGPGDELIVAVACDRSRIELLRNFVCACRRIGCTVAVATSIGPIRAATGLAPAPASALLDRVVVFAADTETHEFAENVLNLTAFRFPEELFRRRPTENRAAAERPDNGGEWGGVGGVADSTGIDGDYANRGFHYDMAKLWAMDLLVGLSGFDTADYTAVSRRSGRRSDANRKRSKYASTYDVLLHDVEAFVPLRKDYLSRQFPPAGGGAGGSDDLRFLRLPAYYRRDRPADRLDPRARRPAGTSSSSSSSYTASCRSVAGPPRLIWSKSNERTKYFWSVMTKRGDLLLKTQSLDETMAAVVGDVRNHYALRATDYDAAYDPDYRKDLVGLFGGDAGATRETDTYAASIDGARSAAVPEEITDRIVRLQRMGAWHVRDQCPDSRFHRRTTTDDCCRTERIDQVK